MANKGQPIEAQDQSEQLDFWQALNAAALAVQQASHSETAVYDAFAAQLVKLGIYGTISMLDETGTQTQDADGLINYARGIKDIKVYLDDIICFSNSWDEYLQLLEQVLQHLEDNDFSVNLAKCKWSI